MADLLIDGPQNANVLLLSHGSGAAMDTPFMNDFTNYIAANAVKVVRFEFSFMAGRRTTGKKPPPPKAEKLIGEFSAVLEQIKAEKIAEMKIFIGGKSLGGRVASVCAQNWYETGEINGLVCLGYPFHPPGKPEKLRTDHFSQFDCPSLICQGENDPFGKRAEIETYTLPQSFQFHWSPQGNHNLTPPKRSGVNEQENLQAVAATVAGFMNN